MYQVTFVNTFKHFSSQEKASGDPCILVVADQERALALASMLSKISTPDASITDVIVSPYLEFDLLVEKLNPLKFMIHETEKN